MKGRATPQQIAYTKDLHSILETGRLETESKLADLIHKTIGCYDGMEVKKEGNIYMVRPEKDWLGNLICRVEFMKLLSIDSFGREVPIVKANGDVNPVQAEIYNPHIIGQAEQFKKAYEKEFSSECHLRRNF